MNETYKTCNVNHRFAFTWTLVHLIVGTFHFFKLFISRMWADAQRDGRPAEYRWRRLRKFHNSIPCTMPQTLAEPAAGAPCSNAANIGERKTWT